MKKQEINIIEIDSRDIRYQTGIARYFDVLADNMPKHIKTYKVIFYRSPDIQDVRITQTETELQIFHPAAFPASTLYEAAVAFIGRRLNEVKNPIIKSNCLGCEQLTYLIRGRFPCKTMGVLHCQPPVMTMAPGMIPANPFALMDHIVLVSQGGKAYLDAVKNKQPVSVIYNGITKPKIVGKKPKDGVFRFIFANGWAVHKGFEKIIPAIRKVAEKHKIEVIVLGGEPENNKVFEQIADLPIIKTGLITDADEIAKYYEMADCALFASMSEACSFAAIEAMAYNLPIVSTAVVGMIEMLNNVALMVKMNDKYEIDTDEYAAQMVRVIESKTLRMKLGVQSYARYLEKYTAKKMVHDTIDVYEKLIK